MQPDPQPNQLAQIIRTNVVYENSDLVIKTKDGIELHVHWETLCEASEHFRSLHSYAAHQNSPGFVEVSEDSTLFLPFMSYIYYNTFPTVFRPKYKD